MTNEDATCKITYRGWPGHFILSARCVFHLNTLIEISTPHRGVAQIQRFVVSTVGNLRDHLKNDKIEPVSGDFGPNPMFYETMAFPARMYQGYWEADVEHYIGIRCRNGLGKLAKDCDEQADRMHYDAVQEIIERAKSGEFIPKDGAEGERSESNDAARS